MEATANAEITRQIMELIDGITDRGTVTPARRRHPHLHRLFRWAVGRGIIATRPMAYLPRQGVEVTRKRVLNDEEQRLAWGAAQKNWMANGPDPNVRATE